jgi:hypothetical protein
MFMGATVALEHMAKTPSNDARAIQGDARRSLVT